MRNFTDKFVSNIKPPPKPQQRRYWEHIQTGLQLCLLVSYGGGKGWSAMVYENGRGRSVRLGKYPEMSVAAARAEAKKCFEDPQRFKAEQAAGAFRDVAEAFITRHLARLRTGNRAAADIRRELIPRWGNRPITKITRHDVIAMLDETVDRGAPYVAHQLLAYCSKLWNWAIARGVYGLETSPCDRVKARDIIGKKEKRQRVLSDNEIRLIWQATAALDFPVAPLVRLLLITGQRLREVAEARWREIDLGQRLWTIPAERMKGDAPHEVPLSTMALEALSTLPRFNGGDFIFSFSGERPVSGFSQFKKRVDDALSAQAEAAGVDAMAGWRFHDLRRSMRTHLSALPLQDMVRELVIAHAQPSLHQVYDQHSYQSEKRQALDLWASRLRSILDPPPPPPLSIGEPPRVSSLVEFPLRQTG